MSGKPSAPGRFQQAVPSLPVKDCAEAIRWYCDVLGFTKDFDDAVLGRDELHFSSTIPS